MHVFAIFGADFEKLHIVLLGDCVPFFESDLPLVIQVTFGAY